MNFKAILHAAQRNILARVHTHICSCFVLISSSALPLPLLLLLLSTTTAKRLQPMCNLMTLTTLSEDVMQDIETANSNKN